MDDDDDDDDVCDCGGGSGRNDDVVQCVPFHPVAHRHFERDSDQFPCTHGDVKHSGPVNPSVHAHSPDREIARVPHNDVKQNESPCHGNGHAHTLTLSWMCNAPPF